jgi:hypothetical protein
MLRLRSSYRKSCWKVRKTTGNNEPTGSIQTEGEFIMLTSTHHELYSRQKYVPDQQMNTSDINKI